MTTPTDHDDFRSGPSHQLFGIAVDTPMMGCHHQRTIDRRPGKQSVQPRPFQIAREQYPFARMFDLDFGLRGELIRAFPNIGQTDLPRYEEKVLSLVTRIWMDKYDHFISKWILNTSTDHPTNP